MIQFKRYKTASEGSLHPRPKQAVRQLLLVIYEFFLFRFKGLKCLLFVVFLLLIVIVGQLVKVRVFVTLCAPIVIKKVLSILLVGFFVMSMTAASVSAGDNHKGKGDHHKGKVIFVVYDGHTGDHYRNHYSIHKSDRDYDKNYQDGYKAGWGDGYNDLNFNGDTGNKGYDAGYKDGYNTAKTKPAQMKPAQMKQRRQQPQQPLQRQAPQ